MRNVLRHHKRLEKALAELLGEAMLVSELDGYLAGLLVCPELIIPSEWLTLVWGAEDDEPTFASSRQVETVAGLVMEHYNAIARDLMAGQYSPVFDVDRRHDEVLWELWIDGFDRAMQLRTEAWLGLSGKPARRALADLNTLIEISTGESELSDQVRDDLTLRAPDLIPGLVAILHAARPHAASPPALTRVGRNDPCPCGSGRKYKKCCGLN